MKRCCTPLPYLALLCLAPPTGAAEGGAWIQRDDMPTARQEIYVAAAAGKVYVPGGILGDGTSFTDAFEAYDSTEDSWRRLQPMPAPRHHVTPVIAGDELFAIGGFEGPFPQWRMRGEVFVYDLREGTWSTGTPLPGPQGEHVAAAVDGRLHVIGGRVPESPGADHFDEYVDTGEHWIFERGRAAWTEGPPAPTARNSAAAAVIGERIYVVGGRRNIRQADGSLLQHNVATLEIYDTARATWHTGTPLPQAQGGLAAAAYEGKLYALGGEQWTPEQRVFAHAWRYDPATDQWSRLPDLPTPRHGLAAAAAHDGIAVIGGATSVGGGTAVATVETFVPEESSPEGASYTER